MYSVTTFRKFLRLSELASLHCCDVKFIDKVGDTRFVKLYICGKSKTDMYRAGDKVLKAETNDSSCPFNILS